MQYFGDHRSGHVALEEGLSKCSNISDKGFLTPNSCTRFSLTGDNPQMNFTLMSIPSKSSPTPIVCNFIILMYSLTELPHCVGYGIFSSFSIQYWNFSKLDRSFCTILPIGLRYSYVNIFNLL